MQRETFNLAKSRLQHSHKIHLHCFTGTNDDVNMWGDYFTNLKFGFTNMVTYHNNKSDTNQTQHQEVVAALGLERMLLETDSPYFETTNRYALPGDILTVAARITDVKSVSPYHVLKKVMENVKYIYNIN